MLDDHSSLASHLQWKIGFSSYQYIKVLATTIDNSDIGQKLILSGHRYLAVPLLLSMYM